MISADSSQDESMPVSAHVRELRGRLAVALAAIAAAAGASLIFSDEILSWVQAPLAAALPQGSHFVALSPMEGWLVHLKASVACALFVAAPVWFYEIWAFAAPALNRRHRRRIVWAAATSSSLFLAGGLICYCIMLPHAFRYFVAILDGSGIVLSPQISIYLGFTLRALVAFGLIFQVPLFTILLVKWRIVRLASLARARKYVVVGAFIAAAVITPPDIFTQIALALPLIVLYELALLAARIFEK